MSAEAAPTAARRRGGRRRRSSVETVVRNKNKRMSMPMNAFSGPLAEPSENSAAAGASRGFRRGSDFMQSYLPGTSRAVGPDSIGSEYGGGSSWGSGDGPADERASDSDEGDGEQNDEEEDAYDFPWWWFIYLCLPSVPGRLFGHALWSVIWPKTISDMAGYEYKALVLAACGQVGTVLGYSAPFVGAFSDQLPERWARRLGGRRRPFIVVGCLIGTVSCYITYDAAYRRPLTKWVYAELLFSMVLGSIGGCISGPPFSAIIPETIPVRQRGLCITIQSWFNTLINIGGNAIGYMVGEGIFLTTDQVSKVVSSLALPLELCLRQCLSLPSDCRWRSTRSGGSTSYMARSCSRWCC
eukprot:SAG22_NODE_872_length_6726_cov_2.255923_4_plen_355_part_00